jgi:carboxyl-terminal processing protease
MTGSASECFSGGLQSLGRARVFGETTMGQALPALFDRLPNGDVLIHAWGDFVTGTGVRIEGRGVVPDEPVALTRSQLLAGRDAALEEALAWIDQVRKESRNSR